MDDSIIYIRAPFSLDRDFVFGGEFMEDAKAVLALHESQIDAIVAALEQHTGFLDGDSIEKLLAPHVDDEKHRKRLSRLISFLDKIIAKTDKTLEDFIKSAPNLIKEQSSGGLSDQEIALLIERVSALIKDQPGFRRQRKAERLYEELGIPVRDIKILCDLRPVFDKQHDTVEGMILVTTLKIVATDVDGLPISLQAKLTEEQVADLAEKAGEAKRKLAVLRSLMEEKDLPVPFSGK